MLNYQIRPLDQSTDTWIEDFLITQWGSTHIVTRGIIHDASHLPGFVSVYRDQHIGLITYHIQNKACEIISLGSEIEGRGVGSALIEAVKQKAKSTSCHRLWVITTNDNLTGLHFYQKRGFHLVTVHRHAIEHSRKLKPIIPKLGIGGIPIRDEIELDMLLR